MNDNIIIQSEQYNVKGFRYFAFLVSIVLIGAGVCLYILNFDGCRESYSSFFGKTYYHYYSIWDMILLESVEVSGVLIDCGILLVVVVVIVGFWLSSYQLVVTDKRIYGFTSWGKRVDLPVDSVTAVSSSTLKGIAIATSSGRIVFKLIKNRDAVYSEINKLLISRQKPSRNEELPSINTDSLEELKKLKKLMDEDIITEEEFNSKKKQILGL